MNVAVLKSKAEQALTEQFANLADKLPGDAAVAQAREQAIGRFAALGLPHRRVEAWKYTDLRAALREAYLPTIGTPSQLDAAGLEAALGDELATLDTARIVFVNGSFAPALSRFDEGRGEAYYFDPLSHGLEAPGFDWVAGRLADDSGPKGETVVALNTAFARDGVMLRVEPGARPARPLHLVFVTDAGEPQSTYPRNLIRIGAGAEVALIETHLGLGDTPHQTNAVLELVVADGARLTHVKTVGEGTSSTHIGTSIVSLGAKVDYRSFQFTSGTALTRNQTFLTFQGEGSTIDLSGAFLGRGSEHIDTTLVVDHAVPRCTSRELFKGVLDDRARGVFQGKVIVQPDAQKTDGKQMAQALMLSPDAEFDSKPELEIYADDVICGHGSTAAEIDHDLLFYCRSRGIPLAEARALLIEAFIGEALDKVELEPLREALAAIARGWLATAGVKN
jgi:Fe-S cluster assembly protein SufD